MTGRQSGNSNQPTGSDRGQIVDYLHKQLIGPVGGPNETLPDPPGERYLMGLLFPQRAAMEHAFEADQVDDVAVQNGREISDDPVALSSQHMPSSLGLSFLLGEESLLEVVVAGVAVYEQVGSEWERNDLADPQESIRLEPSDGPELQRTVILGGRAEITSRWRPFGSGHLVTVALVNLASTPEGKRHDNSKVLCQVELECRSEKFLRYPTNDSEGLDPEDEEQALLYRDVPTFAIGHGCAADWEATSEALEHPTWVRTNFLPSEVLPGVSFDIKGHEKVLDLHRLARIDQGHEETIELLKEFSCTYRNWIRATVDETQVHTRLIPARDRIADRLEKAADRIDEGISFLSDNSSRGVQIRRAFGLANRAMLMQMHHSQNIAAERRKRADAIDPTCDYDTVGSMSWRPFQLAFLLMTLPSVTDPEHPEHDTVDLIWFPTGGGKTEAYLGLVAYQVLFRRMELGDGGAGTTVITRYTLRLLTTQQFQRSAALICALELLRRGTAETLGNEPVSIGMWVGGGTTPNTLFKARDLLAELQAGRTQEEGFILELCPWCGTEVVPESPVEEDDWGIVATATEFNMNCPNQRCPFHFRLPVSVVDEDLYDHPPTFLIGTIDKFARFAWDARPGAFLGTGNFPGPSLIIQDELHTISGPLGTVAGLYEAAFDLVMAHSGSRPKVIASTATINRADEQVRGLFDRDVFLFPPSGMSHKDSFFVHFDDSVPGRRYVGVMAQSHSPTTSNVHTTAALLCAPLDLGLSGASLDAYWTLVAYQNSLKEVGKTRNIARDDIPARMRVIRTTGQVRQLDRSDDVVELTSNLGANEIPKALELLERGHSNGQGPDAVSIAVCTNMIQVGLDIQRLSLMLVNGQPKSTSEYIQATSRVGRKTGGPPGLVVALYSAAKPRDRSHYESFKPYHASIYRSVEPTSVTPWALPARKRALHATFVILARQLLGLPEDADADRFVRSAQVDNLIEAIVTRSANSDPREAAATRAHLQLLVDQWQTEAASRPDDKPLHYEHEPAEDQRRLLKRFRSKLPGLWPTLDSMRNVDSETLVKVNGERT